MAAPNFFIFTLTTDVEHPGLKRLEASADDHGVNLVTLKGFAKGDYEGYLRCKHLEILEVLQDVKPKQFLFLDAWDTVFVGLPGLEVMNEEGLCFGGEKNCYPEVGLKGIYPFPDEPFPYLNSGVIWGRTSEYIHLCPRQVEHDQLAWTKVYGLKPESIFIDTHARHVLNLHSTNPGDLSRFPDGVRYNPTGTWPFIIHGNGKWPLPSWVEN